MREPILSDNLLSADRTMALKGAVPRALPKDKHHSISMTYVWLSGRVQEVSFIILITRGIFMKRGLSPHTCPIRSSNRCF